MKFDDSTIAKNISVATEFFKAYQAVKINKPDVKYPGGTTGFIPFNIEFTLDGISGIKIYDKLVIDTSFLPLNYTDTTEFIVTGVDHSLKDGDWETIIKTTLIPKFDETNETITAKDSNIVTYKLPPSPSAVNSTSPLNITSEDGPANGIYISPAAKANNVGEFVDVTKTLTNKTLQKLAQLNGGLYPIKFYTKPGDSSGTKYGKVTSFNGTRNVYEKNPAFSPNFAQWTYTGSSGFKKSASVNKLWIPTMTQIAQALDNNGMWNATYIKGWDPGIVYRDVTPGKSPSYGQISAHAFGMAIDINSSLYAPGASGAAKWKTDFANNVPTALVHQYIADKFVNQQGGAQKVFWLKNTDVMHFSVVYEI